MASGEQSIPSLPRLTVVADTATLAEHAAAEIATGLEDARDERGSAHVALSGGTTPVGAYELLAGTVRDWRGVELWFADERCVPPDDEESNFRLVAETLVRGTREHAQIPLEDAQVQRMEGELGPYAGAERYAQRLAERVAPDADGLPVLDVAVLGIGPEGHIASLFPDTDALIATGALCLGIEDSPKPPPQRITLSLPVLRAVRRCLLLAVGEGKAQALAAALEEPSPAAPASLLARERLTVIADEAAAARIPARYPRARVAAAPRRTSPPTL
jgi:6-phosphogluconolactonase